MHNHLDKNYNLCSKKYLFLNLKQFCMNQGDTVYDYVPLTFHIKNGVDDPEFKKFEKYYKYVEKKNLKLEQEAEENT